MKGDRGTSLVNASNGRSARGPLEERLLRSLWNRQVDLTVGRIYDRNAVTTR